MLVQLCIHEGALHQGLTVIEDTIDLDGRDVLAQRGELALLNRTDLALRVEYIDMDALYAEEAIGYCRACIARGGHEDIDLLVVLLLTDKVLEQARHEPGTHILEGEGGAMEQLQRIDILLDLHHRTVEGEGVVDNLLQRIGLHILSEESVGYGVGNLLE